MNSLLPNSMVNLLNIIKNYSEQNNMEYGRILEDYFGFAYLGGDELRYQNTPPELMSFAAQGVDGVHYGYVIHVPEMPRSDYPVGIFCPMDDEGVVLCGENTVLALENLLSYQIDLNDYSGIEHKRLIKELSKHNIKPTKAKANRMYDRRGNGKRIRPEIPNNYFYIQTSDGIGALAPKDTFSKSKLAKYDISDVDIYDKFIIKSADAVKYDLYGDALYYLKELYWNNWMYNDKLNIISDLLYKVYKALNREVFASIIKNGVDGTIRS